MDDKEIMTTLSAVVAQIKLSTDDAEESTSIYLNEIFDAINDGFKSLTESVEIGFSLLDGNMASPLNRLLDEELKDDETPKVFDEINQSIKSLKDGLNDQKISVDIDNVSSNITEKLKEISNSEGMLTQFESLRSQLDTSSSESRAIAIEQLEEFAQLVEATGSSQQSEEDRRESNTITSRISSSIEGLGKGIKDLGDNLGDVVGATAKGVGIAGLVMLFLDPEKAMELISVAMEIFTDGLTAITDLLTGSTDGLFDFIDDNPLTSIIIGIAAVFAIISVVGAIMTKLIAALGGIGVALSAFSWPLIAIGAAIGLAIYSLVDAFQSALDVFDDTGSIGAALKDFFSGFIGNIVGLILNIPKAIISWIAGALGFEEFSALLDSFSFVDLIKTTIGNVIDVIGTTINAFLAPFMILGELISNVFGGLSDVFGGLFDIIKGIFTFDLELIGNGLSAIFDGIVDIILAPFKALGDLMTLAFDMLKAAFDGIKNFVLNPIDSVLGFFGIGGPDEDEKDLARKEEALKTETNPLKKAELETEIAEMKADKESAKIRAEEKTAIESQEKAKDNFFDSGGWLGDASIDRTAISKVATSDLKEILSSADTLNGEDYKFIEEVVSTREAEALKGNPDTAAAGGSKLSIDDVLSKIDSDVSSVQSNVDERVSNVGNFKGFGVETQSVFANPTDTVTKVEDTSNAVISKDDTSSIIEKVVATTDKDSMSSRIESTSSSIFDNASDKDISSIAKMFGISIPTTNKADTSSRIESTSSSIFDNASDKDISRIESTSSATDVLTNSSDSNVLTSIIEGAKVLSTGPNSITNIAETLNQGNLKNVVGGRVSTAVSNKINGNERITKIMDTANESGLGSMIGGLFGMSELSPEAIGESISGMITSSPIGDTIESANESITNFEVNKPVTQLRNAQLENNQLHDMDKDAGSKAVVSAINNSSSSNSSNSTTIINNNNKGIDDLIRGMAYVPV